MGADANEILETVGTLLREVLDKPDLKVDNSTSAEHVAEWDSLAQIRLVVSVEQKYGIQLKQHEIESAQSIGDLVNAVSGRLAT